MNIEISEDTADEIMEACLVLVYKDVQEYLRTPERWHEDDVKAFQEVFDAMKIVGPWCVENWKKRTE